MRIKDTLLSLFGVAVLIGVCLLFSYVGDKSEDNERKQEQAEYERENNPRRHAGRQEIDFGDSVYIVKTIIDTVYKWGN